MHQTGYSEHLNKDFVARLDMRCASTVLAARSLLSNKSNQKFIGVGIHSILNPTSVLIDLRRLPNAQENFF